MLSSIDYLTTGEDTLTPLHSREDNREREGGEKSDNHTAGENSLSEQIFGKDPTALMSESHNYLASCIIAVVPDFL